VGTNPLKDYYERFCRAREESNSARRAVELQGLLDDLEADGAAAWLREEVVEALEATERLLAEEWKDESRVTVSAPFTLADVEAAVAREFAHTAPKMVSTGPRRYLVFRMRQRGRGTRRPGRRSHARAGRCARGDPDPAGEPASRPRTLKEGLAAALEAGERWKAAALGFRRVAGDAAGAAEFWRESSSRWRALAESLLPGEDGSHE
jgi:hypothetical protein